MAASNRPLRIVVDVALIDDLDFHAGAHPPELILNVHGGRLIFRDITTHNRGKPKGPPIAFAPAVPARCAPAGGVEQRLGRVVRDWRGQLATLELTTGERPIDKPDRVRHAEHLRNFLVVFRVSQLDQHIAGG